MGWHKQPCCTHKPPRLSPGLGKGGRGAEGEKSMDLACRPGMEPASGDSLGPRGCTLRVAIIDKEEMVSGICGL